MTSGNPAPQDATGAGGTTARASSHGTIAALGPAFVAAIAYVDPGNVAANVSAGAGHGYLLVWVLVLANLMAMVIQYLSAKLGIVTGLSLPQVLGDSLPPGTRVLYWAQAQLMAIATDVAEVIGGLLADRWLGMRKAVSFGGLLGEQALRLVMLAFILQRFRARIRFFPMSQQMLAIGGLLFNAFDERNSLLTLAVVAVVAAAITWRLDHPKFLRADVR